MSSDDVRVESGTVTWDPSRVTHWNDPLETNRACTKLSLADELKFRFIIGDRGNIYDVRAHIDLFACTRWYWELRVHMLKNFKLQLHCGYRLRVPIPAPDIPNIVGMTERHLEDFFRRKIITETIQPVDFYK